jgi:hypothetical protein
MGGIGEKNIACFTGNHRWPPNLLVTSDLVNYQSISKTHLVNPDDAGELIENTAEIFRWSLPPWAVTGRIFLRIIAKV